MRLIKIAAIAIGVLVIAAAIVAAYGIPARGLIESYTRDALAKNELKLEIAGDARFSIWPAAGVTIERMRLRDLAGADDLLTIERVRAGDDHVEQGPHHVRQVEATYRAVFEQDVGTPIETGHNP